MSSSQLYLIEQEVPPRAVVLLYPPGSDEPARDDKGPLPPLQCLIGGISQMGPRFYPVPSLAPGSKGEINSSSFADFHAGSRFVPKDVYTTSDAPVDTEFAVFQNGRRLTCSDLGCTVMAYNYNLNVVKAPDGSFKPDVWHDCSLRGQALTLPLDVVLVAITDIGAKVKKSPR